LEALEQIKEEIRKKIANERKQKRMGLLAGTTTTTGADNNESHVS